LLTPNCVPKPTHHWCTQANSLLALIGQCQGSIISIIMIIYLSSQHYSGAAHPCTFRISLLVLLRLLRLLIISCCSGYYTVNTCVAFLLMLLWEECLVSCNSNELFLIEMQIKSLYGIGHVAYIRIRLLSAVEIYIAKIWMI